MISVHVTAHGSGYYVSVHHEQRQGDEGTCCSAEEHTHARAYPQRGDNDREQRAAVMAAIEAALRPFNHAEFFRMTGDDVPLW